MKVLHHRNHQHFPWLNHGTSQNVHPISIIFQLFMTPTTMVYDTYLKAFGIKTILKSLNKKHVFFEHPS